MRKQLSSQMLSLLDEVIEKYGIDSQLQCAIVENRPVSESDREKLVDSVVLEFSKTGLLHGDEPNIRGMQLEQLIDWINDFS